MLNLLLQLLLNFNPAPIHDFAAFIGLGFDQTVAVLKIGTSAASFFSS